MIASTSSALALVPDILSINVESSSQFKRILRRRDERCALYLSALRNFSWTVIPNLPPLYKAASSTSDHAISPVLLTASMIPVEVSATRGSLEKRLRNKVAVSIKYTRNKIPKHPIINHTIQLDGTLVLSIATNSPPIPTLSGNTIAKTAILCRRELK